MRMRTGAAAAIGLMALAGCDPAVPDSGARLDGRPVDIGRGVGFGSYEAYEQSRLNGQQAAPGAGQPAISSDELRRAGLPAGGTSGTDYAGLPPVGAAGAQPSAAQTSLPVAAPVATTPLNAAQPGPLPGASGSPVIDRNNPGISDEQDFDAVANRETIESDAERLARQRAAYQVIQPTAVPQRSGNAGPNIVAFALQTTNAVGQSLYQRSGFNLEGKFRRNCADYASPDLAQADFLRNGGPERDRKGLDPDGDGFACYWDPTPFRKVRG